MRSGVAIKLAISNEQLAIQVSAPPTILLYAGFGGERALRAIIKMPRSAPVKAVTRNLLPVSRSTHDSQSYSGKMQYIFLFPISSSCSTINKNNKAGLALRVRRVYA